MTIRATQHDTYVIRYGKMRLGEIRVDLTEDSAPIEASSEDGFLDTGWQTADARHRAITAARLVAGKIVRDSGDDFDEDEVSVEAA